MPWSAKLNSRPKRRCSTARRVIGEGVVELSAESRSKRRRRDLTSAASNRDSRSHVTMGPQAAKKLHTAKKTLQENASRHKKNITKCLKQKP